MAGPRLNLSIDDDEHLQIRRDDVAGPGIAEAPDRGVPHCRQEVGAARRIPQVVPLLEQPCDDVLDDVLGLAADDLTRDVDRVYAIGEVELEDFMIGDDAALHQRREPAPLLQQGSQKSRRVSWPNSTPQPRHSRGFSTFKSRASLAGDRRTRRR